MKVNKMSLSSDKYALVSREYFEPDFYDQFFEIVKLAKRNGAGTLVFALHTFDEKYLHRSTFRERLKQETCFGLKILFEISDLAETRTNNTQVITTNGALKLFYQWCSKGSSDPILFKEALVADLPTRMLDDDTLVLVCGEISLLTANHSDRSVRDDFGLLPWLKNNQVKVIISAAHDLFLRWEMPLKKQELSKQNRLILSVWNGNRKKRNSKVPWSAYHDSVNVTAQIVELKDHDLRKDIRIGIFNTINTFKENL